MSIVRNRHPLKFLPDRTLNPQWKQRPGGIKSERTQHQFLALDGEGITINGVHSYVLLMCSDGSVLRNPDGISTVDALSWLVALGRRHKENREKARKIFVGFSISYDVNMILKDVDWRTLKKLHTNGKVWWKGFYIEWKPQKQFIVKRWHPEKRGEKIGIIIYDTFGFFQSSFVKAIADWLGTDSSSYEFVKVQKSKRHEFRVCDLDTIGRYCGEELRFLVHLLDRLDSAALSCGLNLGRYDGAGAIAARLMVKHRIGEHLVDYFQNDSVANAVRSSYFGGRIEQVCYGTSQQSWDYDINSAYVRGLCEVPSLKGGVWEYEPYPLEPVSFALYHVRWEFSEDALPFFPFPYRQPNGVTHYPPSGEGWYWGVEVTAPYKRFGGNIELLEAWIFKPASSEKPYSFLWDLYQQRADWKAEGNQAAQALKLGMNSLYGKHAQHVGWTEKDGRRKPPKSHQLEYAGFTTAYTRSQLWMLGMSNPYSIIAFQTDGIYSRDRLNAAISSGLGDWTEQNCGMSVFVQSGVYFTHIGETNDDGSSKERCYSRGFDTADRGDGRAYLTLSGVLSGWRERSESINVSCTRFVTFSSGVASKVLRKHWRKWRTVDRKLSLTPRGTKRMIVESERHKNPTKELIRTQALINVNPNPSYPYPLPWEPFIFDMDGVPDRIIERELKESEE